MRYRSVTAAAIFIFVLFSLSFPGRLQAKDEIEFKEIKFNKVLEFSDSSEDFYFKYPDNPYNRQIQVDDEGNIYVLDSNIIQKFDGSGKYIKSLVRDGQGPGEVTNIGTFLVNSSGITIFNRFPDKIILKDKDGALLREFRVKKTVEYLFAVYAGNYYFTDNELPQIKNYNGDMIDINFVLLKISPDGANEQEKDCRFPIKTFIVARDGGRSEIRLGELLAAPFKNRFVFVTHSTEYEIKLFDLDKIAVVKTFKRDYKRRKPPEEVAKRLNRQAFMFIDKIYHRPPQKYLNDIQQLLIYKDNLWAATSTVDAKKGVLVDVYNDKCEYKGNFYLKLSDRLSYLDYFSFYAYIFGDYLYIIERDKDDNPWLVKYRIER